MAILNLFTIVLLVEIVFRGQSEASPTRLGPSTTYGQSDCSDGATQETGEECCCGSCYPSIVSVCQDGVWNILYFTDACLSPSCGGRQLITS
eukprot:GFUD01013704.1.p1 GENE.GFUD01013704.1~~GFUD01013704.1.p1  ORF type:complete len:106 (-),score=14.58 GFUD01013704.1:523-798(-)